MVKTSKEIKEDKFKKLSSMEKFAYLWRRDRIVKRNSIYISEILGETLALIKFYGFIILLIPLYKLAFGNEVLLKIISPIAILWPILFKIWVWVVIILLMLSIYNLYTRSKQLAKLDEEVLHGR